MAEDRPPQDICRRFNSLHWHDSKLVGVHISYSADDRTDDVCFQIELLTNPQPGNYQWKSAKLKITECTIIKLDMDLDGKHVCSDDIAEAFCTAESPLKDQLEREQLKHEEKPLAGYLHFRISLIPPGGEIDLFAKDFELLMEPDK